MVTMVTNCVSEVYLWEAGAPDSEQSLITLLVSREEVEPLDDRSVFLFARE